MVGELTLALLSKPKGVFIVGFAWMLFLISFGPAWFHRQRRLNSLFRRRIMLGLWAFLMSTVLILINMTISISRATALRECESTDVSCGAIEERYETYLLLLNPLQSIPEMITVSAAKWTLLGGALIMIVLSLMLVAPVMLDGFRRLMSRTPLQHKDYQPLPRAEDSAAEG